MTFDRALPVCVIALLGFVSLCGGGGWVAWSLICAALWGVAKGWRE